MSEDLSKCLTKLNWKLNNFKPHSINEGFVDWQKTPVFNFLLISVDNFKEKSLKK